MKVITLAMTNKVVRYLILSQLSLYGFLGICSFINPEFLFGEGGVSNYGVYRTTVVPFTSAFLLSGMFLILASRCIPKSPVTSLRIRRALWVQALLLFAVLLSTYPYKLNHTYKYMHITAGVLLLIFNVILVSWVTLRVYRDKINILLLIGEFVGFLITLLTLLGVIHWLFVAQVLTSLFFGVFIIRLGKRITSE